MSDTLPAADLDELERLEREATPGPWEVAGPYPMVTVGVPNGENDPEVNWFGFDPLLELHETAEKYGDCKKVPDAALIAAVRNALPRLLAAARESLSNETVAANCLQQRDEAVKCLKTYMDRVKDREARIAALEAERDALRGQVERLEKENDSLRRPPVTIICEGCDSPAFARRGDTHCEECRALYPEPKENDQ